MITFINYLNAFWSIVIINCIQPVNWKHCLPVHDWLFPSVKEGIEIYLNPSSIYQKERDYINKER